MFKHRVKAVYLLILAVLIGYFSYATQTPDNWIGFRPFRLGLDLSGGSHLVYKADVSKLNHSDIGASMDSLRDVVEKRVNTFGVSEPIVQTQENAALSDKESAYRLIVELPGVTDVEEAARSIGATPDLDFRLVTATKAQAFDVSSSRAKIGTTTADKNRAYFSLFSPIGLTGSMVSRATLEFNQTTNQPVVGLSFTKEGRDLFASTTKNHIGDYIGIFLDGSPISVPVVREAIVDGRAEISGNFTISEASKLVRDLNYGALPVPISLISTQTIGPSLGETAVNGGIRSGIIAFILISLFLIAWYRLPGLVAVLALGIYTSIMLALFKIIPVTLTAAGIAGFIITIGMAVDANILIFERMKEELHRGRGVWDAMHEGFARAWTSIRDSNVSSIITGVILYYFGSSSIVTGFALVFLIGVIVSMFTAITVSRLFLYAVAPQRQTKLSLFLINNGFNLKK